MDAAGWYGVLGDPDDPHLLPGVLRHATGCGVVPVEGPGLGDVGGGGANYYFEQIAGIF